MKKTSSKIKTSPQEKFLHVLNVFFLLIAVFLCVYPFYYMFIPCLTVQGHPWREFISCQRASHWMHIR